MSNCKAGCQYFPCQHNYADFMNPRKEEVWEIGDKLVGECKCDSSKIIEFVLESTLNNLVELKFRAIKSHIVQTLAKDMLTKVGLEIACNTLFAFKEYHNWRRVPKRYYRGEYIIERKTGSIEITRNCEVDTNARFEHRYDMDNYDYSCRWNNKQEKYDHVITKKKPPKPRITVETRHQRIGFPSDIRSWYAVQFKIKTDIERKDINASLIIDGVCQIYIGNNYQTTYNMYSVESDVLYLRPCDMILGWSNTVLMPLITFERLEEIRLKIEEELNK